MMPGISQQCKRIDSCVKMWSIKFYGLSAGGSRSLPLTGKVDRPVWAAEKIWALPFLPRITDACLPAHGKHAGLCGQMKKLSATFSHTQRCLFRALRKVKLWSRIRNLVPTFLLTDESVCTAGLLRPSFIRYIRFVKGQKWIILNTFIVFNIVNKMVLKKHQISEYKAMFFN